MKKLALLTFIILTQVTVAEEGPIYNFNFYNGSSQSLAPKPNKNYQQEAVDEQNDTSLSYFQNIKEPKIYAEETRWELQAGYDHSILDLNSNFGNESELRANLYKVSLTYHVNDYFFLAPSFYSGEVGGDSDFTRLDARVEGFGLDFGFKKTVNPRLTFYYGLGYSRLKGDDYAFGDSVQITNIDGFLRPTVNLNKYLNLSINLKYTTGSVFTSSSSINSTTRGWSTGAALGIKF